MRTYTRLTQLARQAEATRSWQRWREQRRAIIRSRELSRVERELLERQGLLLEIVKGWYFICPSAEPENNLAAWHGSFWRFCSEYLNERFADGWCLAPDTSLCLHAGNWTMPSQVLVCVNKSVNRSVRLPLGRSLLNSTQALPEPGDLEVHRDLRTFKLEAALVNASPEFYAANPEDARSLLGHLATQECDIARLTAGDNHSGVGRLIGALEHIGAEQKAQELRQAVRAAGHTTRVINPFTHHFPWKMAPTGIQP